MTLFTPLRGFLAAIVIAGVSRPVRKRLLGTWDGAASATTLLTVAATTGRASATSTSTRTRCACPDARPRTEALATVGRRRSRMAFGLVAGAGVEFDIAGPWTLAVDYSRVHAVFDQTVASTNARGVDFEKLSNELEVGQASLGAFTTNGVHGVLRLYPLRRCWLRPYGGIGLGYATMRADSGWNWRRSADPLAITTGRDQPNFDEIRTSLAGTVSTGSAVLRKNVHVLAYAAGVDLAVSERSAWSSGQAPSVPVGGVGPYVGATLRGRVPDLRLDGSEPVSAWSTLPRAGVTAVGRQLKYHLASGEWVSRGPVGLLNGGGRERTVMPVRFANGFDVPLGSPFRLA